MDTQPSGPSFAAGASPIPEISGKGMKEKFKRLVSNFRSLPVKSKRLLSLGALAALVIALPVIVLTLTTIRTSFLNRAASGEPAPTPTYISTPTPPAIYCFTASLNPVTKAGIAGTTLTYTLSIFNKDCKNSTFSLETTKYNSGWITILPKTQITVLHGQTGKLNVSFKSPLGTQPSLSAYLVGITVKQGAALLSATAIYQVTPPCQAVQTKVIECRQASNCGGGVLGSACDGVDIYGIQKRWCTRTVTTSICPTPTPFSYPTPPYPTPPPNTPTPVAVPGP